MPSRTVSARSRPRSRSSAPFATRSEALELVKGVHGKAGAKNDRGQGTPLGCDQCHGKLAHYLLPVQRPAVARLSRQPGEDLRRLPRGASGTYLRERARPGDDKMGLMVTAGCADCHGAHGIYRAPDKRSTLNTTHVADTCGKCHRFIEERLAGEHPRRGAGPGGTGRQRSAPGGKPTAEAQLHLLPPGARHAGRDSVASRQQMPNRCGNCHANLSSRYAMSIHGAADRVGLWPGGQVLRLPRRPRHPGRFRSALAALAGESGADVPASATRTRRAISSASIRTPITPTPKRSPLVHGVYIV